MFVKAFSHDNLNRTSTFVMFSNEFSRKIALHSINSADNIKVKANLLLSVSRKKKIRRGNPYLRRLED